MERHEDYPPERVRQIVSTWREMRAHYERSGKVDDDEWAEVLDVERALGALGNYVLRNRPADAFRDDRIERTKAGAELYRRKMFDKAATAAAATLACQMLLGWTSSDVRFALPKDKDVDWSPDLLSRKAVAWMGAYLGGRSFAECDEAFEAET